MLDFSCCSEMIRRYFLACWILTFCAVAGQSTQYALPGQMVTFEPVIKTPPDEILWKHNGNKVIEFNGNEELVYSPFEKRTTLDWHAAVLNIKQLSHNDSGKYELDVLTNKNVNRFYFALEVIDRVAKPTISCKMNNGNSSSDESENEATLMCSADSRQLQSLTFEWSQHGKTYPGPILKILLGKEHDDEVYSCTVSNRLSSEMATFTAKDCHLVRSSTVMSAGLSAGIGVIILLLCVLGTLGIVYCKRKHKACFAKEKTNDVEQQSSLDYTSEPLLDRAPTFPSSQRLRPLPGMIRNKNYNQNGEVDTELDQETGTGFVKRRASKYEQNQEPTALENSEVKLKKTKLHVAKNPSFNGNLARNVKGEADADPHREEMEKKVLAIDHLEDHSRAMQHDLESFTVSELPESEKEEDEEALNMAPADEHEEEKEDAISDQVTRETKEENEKEKEENESDDLREKKELPTIPQKTDLENGTDENKKPGSPVAEKPPFPGNLARKNIGATDIDPHKEPMEKKGLECGGLEEHSGAPKPDLQTSAASERPDSEKEEDKEAPNMTPADEHQKQQDAISDQVTRETKEENEKEKEENESDDVKEKEKSPTTDEQTGLESNKDKSKKNKPAVPKKSPSFKINKGQADVNALREDTVSEGDGLEEHSGATESDLQSSAASEKPGLESNKDKPKKIKPAVPKKSPSFKINKGQADVNALREDKVSERDGLEEHSGATESDLQSSTASEKPGLESNKDKPKKNKPPVPKKSPSFKINKGQADVNALREDKVSERDGLEEHSGATESDLQSSTASEEPGLESNKDKPKKIKPAVPKKSPSFKINKGQADVNALREDKVSERDGLEEHSGATESDLQSSTASEEPGLESNKDKPKKNKPPVPKKSFKINKRQADVNALREDKVSERDGLEEHSGATESDLQSSTASEEPELEKEADDKAKSAPDVGEP